MKIILEILWIFTIVISATCQILAIDFGTQFIKAAVVNKGSGKAFSIVETSKSERKFLNAIGFYSEERFYEAESLPKRTRHPKNCFIYNNLLIDSFSNPDLISTVKKDLLLEYITHQLKDPLLTQFILEHFPKQTAKVTFIEVVAMIIKYAKVNAQKQIKQQIKDVIMTVPSYWNIRQRAFLTEAAQIADLHVLSLISENSAAAINYALNQRTKNTTETILFYNLGSNSIQMTLAQFKQVKQQKSAKPTQSIFILADYGKSYVGGLRYDSLLFQHFKKRFETKYKRQLNLRGSIKLWGEIAEVKQVLSANKEAPIYVQGIMDGIDYHDKITRAQFETMIEPAIKEIVSPIKRFLLDNNFKVADIDNVELIGGSSRIPKLQTMIGQVIGNQSKIGTHINADEAMVLGAAFYGANSSKKFKVKGVNLYDGFNFEIRAVLRNLQQGIDQDNERYFFKNVTVFNKKNRFGLTKQLNFKCKQNIIIELYKQDENGLELLRSDKIDNIKNVNETDFKVSITVAIDPLEVVTIKKAEIKYKKDEIVSYMEKVKKVKSTTDKTQQDKKEEKVEDEKENVNEEQEEEQAKGQNHEQQNNGQEQQTQQTNQQQNEEVEKDDKEQTQKQDKQEKSSDKQKKKEKKKKEPKEEYETVERNKTVTKKYEKDLHSQVIFSREKADHDSLQKSRKMLKEYQRVEEERKRLAESKNRLEGLIYEIKQKLENQEFIEFTKQEQRNNLQQLMTEKETWYDETTSDNKVDYDQHSKVLFKPLDRIKKRIHEYHIREVHYKRALNSIAEYKELSQNITKKKQWITEEEVDLLLQKISEFKKEIEDIYKKMEETSKNESCLFQTKDIDKVVEKAKQQYFKVMATPKPKKQKKEEKKQQKQEKQADQSEEL